MLNPRVRLNQTWKLDEPQVPDEALVMSPDQQSEVKKGLSKGAKVLGMSVPTDPAAAGGAATDLTAGPAAAGGATTDLIPGKGHAISTR